MLPCAHPPACYLNHAQLANVLSAESLFYTCIIPFIIFFGSFAAIMYPMRDVLHPTGECRYHCILLHWWLLIVPCCMMVAFHCT